MRERAAACRPCYDAAKNGCPPFPRTRRRCATGRNWGCRRAGEHTMRVYWVTKRWLLSLVGSVRTATERRRMGTNCWSAMLNGRESVKGDRMYCGETHLDALEAGAVKPLLHFTTGLLEVGRLLFGRRGRDAERLWGRIQRRRGNVCHVSCSRHCARTKAARSRYGCPGTG